MSSLGELRGRLRVLLMDSGTDGYLWSDATLNLYLNEAVRDYGRSLPRGRETVVETVAGQSGYDLPSDCISVVRVEVEGEDGNTLLPPCMGGSSAPGLGCYEQFGGRLILSPTPAEGGLTVAVRYLASHAALASDPEPSTVSAADEDLLLAAACALAMRALSVEKAKRQRFEERSGMRSEEVEALYQRQYERGIRERGAVLRAGRLVAV